jgi:hypothetical protein
VLVYCKDATQVCVCLKLSDLSTHDRQKLMAYNYSDDYLQASLQNRYLSVLLSDLATFEADHDDDLYEQELQAHLALLNG